MAKHRPVPTTVISTPAMAGPTARAEFTSTLLRLTAFLSSSGPTISWTKDWRTGLSQANTTPSSSARPTTIQSWTTPVNTRRASVRAMIPRAAWVVISRRRLSSRSASSPP